MVHAVPYSCDIILPPQHAGGSWAREPSAGSAVLQQNLRSWRLHSLAAAAMTPQTRSLQPAVRPGTGCPSMHSSCAGCSSRSHDRFPQARSNDMCCPEVSMHSLVTRSCCLRWQAGDADGAGACSQMGQSSSGRWQTPGTDARTSSSRSSSSVAALGSRNSSSIATLGGGGSNWNSSVFVGRRYVSQWRCHAYGADGGAAGGRRGGRCNARRSADPGSVGR